MPARHYAVDYSTNGGATWIRAVDDEAPGPGKQLQLSGLAVGTYAVQLRLVPLAGDTTPILSDQTVLTVGIPAISEPVQTTAQSQATIADLMVLRDQLLMAVGVSTALTDTLSATDQVQTPILALADFYDMRVLYDNLIALLSVSANSTDTQAAAEQLVVAVISLPGVTDVYHGVSIENVQSDVTVSPSVVSVQQIAEQLVTNITPQTSIVDGFAYLEQIVASANAVATQTENISTAENLTTAASMIATIDDLKAVLETVLTSASVIPSVTDSPGNASPSTGIQMRQVESMLVTSVVMAQV